MIQLNQLRTLYAKFRADPKSRIDRLLELNEEIEPDLREMHALELVHAYGEAGLKDQAISVASNFLNTCEKSESSLYLVFAERLLAHSITDPIVDQLAKRAMSVARGDTIASAAAYWVRQSLAILILVKKARGEGFRKEKRLLLAEEEWITARNDVVNRALKEGGATKPKKP